MSAKMTTDETKVVAKKPKGEHLVISAPKLRIAEFTIVGSAPYVQNAFSGRAKDDMHKTQEAGSQAKKGKKREPKDFQQQYHDSMHKDAKEDWYGIPATSFRCAMISACRLAGFKMTLAKLSVFVIADGYDADDTPLVRITKGKPQYAEHAVRNANGSADLRARGMWRPGWEAVVRVRFDEDQFSAKDVANLLTRVGFQVGIGAGRPDSRESAGMGWGLFEVKGAPKE